MKKKHLLLTIAIILIFITLKFVFFVFTAPTNYGWNVTNNKIDILITGSSHARQSYDLYKIEKQCHCHAAIFSYPGLDPFSQYEALRYLINQKKITPRLVILEASPFAIFYSPHLSDQRFFHHAPAIFKWQYLQALKQFDPSFSIQKLFQLLVWGKSETFIFEIITNKIVYPDFYHGQYTNRNILGLENFDSLEVSDFTKKLEGKPNNDQINFYQKTASLLKENQISFLFIQTPLPGPIENHPLVKRARSILKNTLNDSAAELIGPWYEKTFLLNDSALYSDSNHVSTKGRELFTDDIIKILIEKNFRN